MLWLNDVDTKPFVNWLRKNNVVGYINATGQSIAPPKVYEDLEDEETKTRYRDAWQKAYKARGIFYEPWLQQNYISRELREAIRPEKIHAASLTAIADKLVQP
jgi:hypothetical protein